jgi:hypothetical protein
MRKKFNKRVLPGVEEVLASFFWLVMALIKVDLPTFERPMKQISGISSSIQPLLSAADVIN